MKRAIVTRAMSPGDCTNISVKECAKECTCSSGVPLTYLWHHTGSKKLSGR